MALFEKMPSALRSDRKYRDIDQLRRTNSKHTDK